MDRFITRILIRLWEASRVPCAGGTCLAPTGAERRGYRPVLIIQNDRGNKNSTTVIVVPVTSKPKRKQRTHVRLKELDMLPKDSVILAEQMRTIDKIRLAEYIGKVSGYVMRRVEKAIRVSVGMKNRDIQKTGEMSSVQTG